MPIRKATKHDAASISTLNADVQKLHADAHPHLFKQPSPELFSREAAEELLTNPDNCIYLAEVDGKAVGYIYAEVRHASENPFFHARSQVYVHQLSVKPDHQKQGHGEKLIQAVKDLAQEQGITTIGLDVWSFNTQASRFFESQGFTVFNQRMWLQTDTKSPST